MKLKDIIYLAVILIVIAVGIKLLADQKNKLKQARENYATELSDEKYKYIKLDKYMSRRLDVYARKVDRLSDSLRIKPKHIREVVEIEVKEIDTVQDTIKIQAPPPDFEWQQFHTETGCMKVSGIAPCDIIFTEKKYSDSLFVFKHDQRRHLFNLKWLPRWGRKETVITSESKCGDVKLIWREMAQ